MKFPIFIDGKETRFPVFEAYDYKNNNNKIVLMMLLKEQEEIDFLIKEQNFLSVDIKDSFIVLENKQIAYAFDFGINIENIKQLFSQGVGIAFGIRNNDNKILKEFGLCFDTQTNL